MAIASALRGMVLRNNVSLALASEQLPTLIITGDQDVVISPKQSEAMHLLAKNRIAGAGHLSNLEKPEEWNQAVVAFLGKE